MEIFEAKIIEEDDKFFISIDAREDKLNIPISEDQANAVKAVFNDLIKKLRDGIFEIQLTEEKSDLPSLVAKEYLSQLNRELTDVHNEMVRLGLLS